MSPWMTALGRAARWAAPALAALSIAGCATVGSVVEVYGQATGEKSLAAAGSSLKRTGEVEDFSEEEKLYTGRTVAASLLAGSKPSENLALERYVGSVGQVLALASGVNGLPQGWHFVLVQDPGANAYAMPGGIILVGERLVRLCESEDELAGVLAHEVAHVALGHPMQGVSAANKKAALLSLAEFGFKKATEGKDLSAMQGQFNAVAKDVAKGVTQGYSRASESEADAEAVRILVETGYDPRGLKRVLSRLKAGDSYHGDPSKRAADVEQACFQAEPVPRPLAARTERFKAALGR